MIAKTALAALVGLCGLAPACDWTTFAQDAAGAPVRSIGAPETFKSGDFGQLLLPLSDGQGKAAAFLASSINESSMLVVTIDAVGGVTSRQVPKTALDEAAGSEITAFAEEPGSSPFRLVLGIPQLMNVAFGRVLSYPLSPTFEATATRVLVPTLPDEESGLGRGLAVGRIGGAEGLPDYVFASDDHLVVSLDVVNGAPANATMPAVTGGTDCDVAWDIGQEPRYLLRRPLLMARLWEDPAGASIQQLVSAATHAASPGKLSFFSVTGGANSSNLNCLATVSAPGPSMRSQFGRSLASGDFNGDGALDLLVGAPAQEAYVFLGPFLPGSVPTPLAILDATGLDFGFSVAALNLDGKPGDEAVIGDPRATVDGKEKAGKVVAYAFDGATMSMKPWRTYTDHSPEVNANYGTTVGALPFCTSLSVGTPCATAVSSKVLLVGASNEVFVYFREGDNIPTRLRDGAMVPDVRSP